MAKVGLVEVHVLTKGPAAAPSALRHDGTDLAAVRAALRRLCDAEPEAL